MKELKNLLKEYKPAQASKKNAVQQVVDFYLTSRGWDNKSKEFYKKMKISYPRLCKEAKDLLSVFKGDIDEALRAIYDMSYRAKKKGFNWTISTIIKSDLKVKL